MSEVVESKKPLEGLIVPKDVPTTPVMEAMRNHIGQLYQAISINEARIAMLEGIIREAGGVIE